MRMVIGSIAAAVFLCAGVTCATALQGTPAFSTTPPSPIDLGPSAVGVTTPHAFPQPLQINNPGTATLSVSGASFTPFEAGFTAESLFLPPISINPGSSRGAGVLFFPQGPGKRTIQLSVTDNAPGSPHVVQFTGTGVAVPTNDIGIILDPAVTAVNVPAGGSTTFPIWILAGPGLGNTNLAVQCTGGPSGTSCSVDHNTDFVVGDSFGSTRDKFMVTIFVPGRSSLAFHKIRALWWTATFAIGILLLGKIRRRMPRFTAIAGLLIVSALMVSCGGSSGGSGSTPLVITATPSPGTPHSLTVPVVVQ